ncbi:hypothetical protein [uncultured Jannaschia sp.]|uniref:hypothetical protein n=1 Tax=uncultured Jannaschia sp. TaxID=293347 RepID=UPI00261D471E|nr:hypothetical protein [uncultured Jannaschia sp.]
MLRQYNPQRHRRALLGSRIRAAGTVPVGTIALIRGRKVQVMAWLPRDDTAVECGRFVTKRIAGGHIALVRDLATGRTGQLSDAWLVDAVTIPTDEPDGRALLRRAALRAEPAIAAVAEDTRELEDAR